MVTQAVSLRRKLTVCVWSRDITNHLLREVVKLFAIVAWPELRKQAFRCSAAERRNVYSTPRKKRLAAPEERNVLVSGADEWLRKTKARSLL